MKPDFLIDNRNGVFYITEPKSEFEQSYVAVRTKENRLLSDELVKKLPFLPKNQSHAKEWKKRKNTLRRFLNYSKNQKNQKILEVGCGNGWFTNQIAKNSIYTIGLDVGQTELNQASRCFSTENVHFLCCNDLSLLPDSTFDCIVFNASIHYFELTSSFWNNLKRLLTKNGEIHILDSPIYSLRELKDAKIRSENYFNSLDEKEAINYYHPFTWKDLPSGYKRLFKPNKWVNYILKNRSPFPWIVIYKN